MDSEQEPHGALKGMTVLQVLGHPHQEGEGEMAAQVSGAIVQGSTSPRTLSFVNRSHQDHIIKKRSACSACLFLSCLKGNSHSLQPAAAQKAMRSPQDFTNRPDLDALPVPPVLSLPSLLLANISVSFKYLMPRPCPVRLKIEKGLK